MTLRHLVTVALVLLSAMPIVAVMPSVQRAHDASQRRDAPPAPTPQKTFVPDVIL